MIGLLVKDFSLMKMQKNYFLVVVAVATLMMIFFKDISVPLGFIMFLASFFSLSTISYDEFDNGNAFLFSLPITRSGYVIEKYCLSLILGCSACALSVLLTLITGMFNRTAPALEIIITSLVLLLLILIIQAFMLPFQLKFGGEKSRIALLGAVGLLFVIGIIVAKIAKFLNVNAAAVINSISQLSAGMWIAVFAAVTIILLLFSMKISIAIVNKKEF